jgi:hypothetical protein
MNTKTCNLNFDTNSDVNKHFLALKKGVLCFPEIDYRNNNRALHESNRLRTSIKKIYKILSDAGYHADLLFSLNLNSGSIATEVSGMEDRIIKGVESYISNQDDQLMKRIFHSIQCWGGGEGRSIYVKPKENGNYRKRFEHNFGSGDYYKKFIDIILKENESRKDKLKDLEECTNSIKNWGLSFASKHMNFISKSVQNNKVPRWYVFDSVISMACFGKLTPDWESYVIYCRELENFANQQGVNGDQFERALFNYLQDDPVGQLWGALRCRKTKAGNISRNDD